jgi:tetratricopeptide (TPR) repeat protein
LKDRKTYVPPSIVFDQAIVVRNELPLELAEYRNALASAYNNRGLALEGLGEPEDLSAAISSFKQAIALRKPLLSIEHRTGLVTAYYNCAAAQQMLGGAKNLQEAIASCNHAVAVGKELPLEAPACRAALAGAFANLGAAQASLGGPDNLRDAITSYGESIALQKELSLEVPNYRHDLAQSYYNRGATQQNLEGRENLLAAINSYDEAIALIFSITMVSTAWADVACSAFLAKATASQTLGDLESNNSRYTIFHQQAINAAKKGLEICRQWRQRGEYGRRNDMEKLLAIGSLSCYQVQPHSLGSFLLENLDPDTPET